MDKWRSHARWHPGTRVEAPPENVRAELRNFTGYDGWTATRTGFPSGAPAELTIMATYGGAPQTDGLPGDPNRWEEGDRAGS